MRAGLEMLCWGGEELPQAFAAAGGATVAAGVHPPPGGPERDGVSRLAAAAGFEADPVTGPPLPPGRRELLLVETGRAGTEPSWWLLRGGRGRRVALLGPEGRRRFLDREEVARLLGQAGRADDDLWARTLAAAGVAPPGGRARGGDRRVPPPDRIRAWRLLPAADLPIGSALVRWGVANALVELAVTHSCQYLLWVGSWWLLGWGALGGRLEPGWIAAWALLLATRVPFGAAATAAGGRAVLLFGLLLRRRLLAGASRLGLDAVRTAGVGQLTGRLLEAAAFETQVFHGGLLTVTAAIELGVATVVLGLGAGGLLHVALLLLWVAAIAGLAVLDARARSLWTRRRLELADLVVERVAGHLTRVVQEAPERWHEGEDEAAAALVAAARRMDGAGSVPMAAVRRCWSLVGIAALGPALLDQPVDLAGVAVGLGGVLLAAASLANLTAGVQRLAAAGIAWRQLRGMLAAPATACGPVDPAPPAGPGGLTARGLAVRRGGRRVLDGLDLELPAGAHVAVEGGCGSGKTTLAETLLDLVPADEGLVLLDGLDPAALGEEWRRRVGGVPEAARDHLLAGSLAFNLLLGRSWPPGPAELEEAATVCRSLGLGEVLVRMPAGLHTQVGDTGWQLSHGERSRVLLARALLRRVRSLALDTPGEGLDPSSSRRVAEVLSGDPRGVVLLVRPRRTAQLGPP